VLKNEANKCITSFVILLLFDEMKKTVQNVVGFCSSNKKSEPLTMWHEIFAGVYFCGLAIFCVLRELIFAIRTDWFLLLRINFCDFQKVPST